MTNTADFTRLESIFSGELYHRTSQSHQAILNLYATDASVYQEKPLAVAIPKTDADLAVLIDFAKSQGITLIPRAAGTSLAGQVVGSGMVVDISRHFTEILEVNQVEKWVRVQPGVIRDDLNAWLKPFGLMFGPETSTSNRAMIGGMIGNNSCGLHSIIWGTTRDNTLSLTCLLSDGTEVIFSNLSPQALAEKCEQINVEGQLYRQVLDLITDEQNRQAIAAGFPKASVQRRNTGYALDVLCQMTQSNPTVPFNLSKLIAGSEGTLCLIKEATLQLIDLPPQAVAIVAIHTETMQEALQANLIGLSHQCSASELVDDLILQFTKTNRAQLKNRFFVEGDPQAILMVEFFGDTEAVLQEKTAALINDLKASGLGYAYPVLYGNDTKKAWELRKAGLGLLRNLPGDMQPVNLIEDCAVDVQDLPFYIADLEQLLKKNGVQYSMYAHAGAGELHVEPMVNLKTMDGQRIFRKILAETTALVKQYGGSLSGEHGDGRLRGEFIPFIMGDYNYALFQQIKGIFDPKGIFNQGKIVDTPPMDTMLRYQADLPHPEIETIFDFSNTESILKLAEKCSGSGDCRKTKVSGGTMCPSYMATRLERDTTRARANMLRHFYSPAPTNTDLSVNTEQVKDILDLCLSCKGCKSECPSSVDVGKMKAEFTQHYHDQYGLPFRSKLIGRFSQQMALASVFPWVYNAIFKTPFLRRIANRMVGFHPDRSMPLLDAQTLGSWWEQVGRNQNPVSSTKRVHLFCDEFTHYNDVELGKKLIQLLQKLGYEVIIPEHVESGRSYLSKGMLRDAQRIAKKNVALLAPHISADAPIIGIEPSALLTLRDEYPDLVGELQREAANQLAQHSFLFEEWFAAEIERGNIPKDAFETTAKTIHLHGHCHQKALSTMTPVLQCLNWPANYTVHLIPSGCCGMAGSFGYEAEHYELSMQIGELVLFPYVRILSDTDLVAASGTSCRHQLKDGTGRKALHPAEILFGSLKGPA